MISRFSTGWDHAQNDALATTEAGFQLQRSIDEEPNLAKFGFADAVVHGLSLKPKRIASKWLYDAEGARLFEEIVASPGYYVPDAEAAILRTHSVEIAEILGSGGSLLELGSGSSTKVRILLNAMRSLRCYLPVDISEAQLLEASETLRRDYPSLLVHPIPADYNRDFELPSLVRDGKLMAFFSGSTLCNLLPHNSVDFLRRMSSVLGSGSLLLVGVDLKKDEAVMLKAYNDPDGPIWHFNLNILARMNRELGTDFDETKFRHEAIYNHEAGRIEAAIYPICDQEINVSSHRLTLRKGEPILLEYSHKYDVEEFQALARQAGWNPRNVWVDPDRLFSVHLLMDGEGKT